MKNKPNLSSYFAQQVITAASIGCGRIQPGTVTGSRQLCGSTFWNTLSKPEQLQAGQILSAAVDAGMLPLIKRNRSLSNHRRYERI